MGGFAEGVSGEGGLEHRQAVVGVGATKCKLFTRAGNPGKENEQPMTVA